MNQVVSSVYGRAVGISVLLLSVLAPSPRLGAAEFDLGLRYDRSRSGHGLEIHRAGDAYAVFFYTYGQDNLPEWFICDARVVNGVMLGDCLRFDAPPEASPPAVADSSQRARFTLDYVAPEQSSACQDGVNRSGAEQLAVFSWRTEGEWLQWCTEFLPVGSAYPERYYGGVWYGGDNGGYGCSLSHMDSTLSAICYYYDALGNPRWAIGLGDIEAESIELIHYEGFCRTCPPRELNGTVAGTLGLNLDEAATPGSGTDRVTLNLEYPEAPGGTFQRDFTLFPLTDGATKSQQEVPTDTVRADEADWRADLAMLETQVRAIHPDPFHSITETEFQGLASSLANRIPFLNDSQVRYEMMRLLAELSRYGKDGHSTAVPLASGALPLQLYEFSDGLFVVDALPPFDDLVGYRITEMGGKPISEVMRLARLALGRDNENTLRWTTPIGLVLFDPLLGLNLADADGVTMRFVSPTGEMLTRTVEPIELEALLAWRDLGRNTLPERPALYLSDTESDFWFVRLEESNTLYIQYNSVTDVDDAGQTLQTFVNRLTTTFNQAQPEKVVIDLRHNVGGNNTTYGPLLDFLASSEVDRDGQLFAIIGRQTFSAAMNFIADLDSRTQAIFVGEGSGGSPFHYGDSVEVPLARAELLLQISSRVHLSPIANDTRPDIPAAIETPLSSNQYYADQDPALEAILAH